MRRLALIGWALSACATSVGPASTPQEPAALDAQRGGAPADTPAPLPVSAATADVVDTVPGVVPPKDEPYLLPLPEVAERMQGVAMRAANVSSNDCLQQLRTGQLPFARVGAADGVATPVRMQGPLGDVDFRVPPPKTPFGVLDCRLALALNELSPVLRAHEVRSLRIDSFYRPRAKLPGRKNKKSQHAYGLAADVVSVTLDDGRTLDIERDFHGQMGKPVCGPDAYLDPPTDEAIRLRNLVCELARGGYFHHLLTPNHDQAHRNHLHLDIKRDNRWFSVE
ncbi:MAG TPA: extensin family protein [Polyangiaceae bacterium]|nr:extensin family protein [Polyangiaceae bacterium]